MTLPPLPVFLYLIGVPGAGKSTLMTAVTRDIPILGSTTRPFSMLHYPGGVQLGRVDTQVFSGTDGLSFSVQKAAMQWADITRQKAAIAEGDRLANIGFLRCVAARWDLTVVYLRVSPETARRRRDSRKLSQDEVWLQSRFTKVLNLVGECNAEKIQVITLDGEQSLEALTLELLKHPVFQLLKKEENSLGW